MASRKCKGCGLCLRFSWALLLLLQVCFFLVYHSTVLKQQEDENNMPLSPTLVHRLKRSSRSATLGGGGGGGRRRREALQRLRRIQDDALRVEHLNTTNATSMTRLLVHLHIGKNGGTSFDKLGPQLARDSGRKFVGRQHFDWSYIETLEHVHPDVVLTLREPVARAVSHFYFSKNLRWTRKLPMGKQTLTEFLHDKEQMLKGRDIWQDGQAAVSWLTGTHIGHFVGIEKDQVDERERIASNYTAMCHLAADRLEQTLWFGILEDLDRSMELLQHALKLNYKPVLPKAKSRKKQPPTEWEKEALASLMPQDLWLYDYGKRLFEARWNAYKTGSDNIVPPQRPPLPKMTCTSTRFDFQCVSGPYADKSVFS